MKENLNLKGYRRDCLFGALSAFLMLAGDLCLSVIPASQTDSGLFLREAYLSGWYPAWRLTLLLAAEMIGMPLAFFTVRALCTQIRPQYRKTRMAVLIGGVIYTATAGVVHFMIGSFADWTSTLGPLLGREETAALISAQYARLAPALLISYAGMVLMLLAGTWAFLSGKTVLPRKMFMFHMLIWQIVLVAIPDIRQALGAEITTLDFVMSQGSGNASLMLWMLANAIWARHVPEAALREEM